MAFGICIGLLLNIIDESAITTAVLNVVVTSKYILGQLISFSVPLIIIGFIAPSITKLGKQWRGAHGCGADDDGDDEGHADDDRGAGRGGAPGLRIVFSRAMADRGARGRPSRTRG